MTQKERLVELLKENSCLDVLDDEHWYKAAEQLLANGVVAIDTDVVSMKNRPLISTVASLPIDEVIDLVKAKEEGRLIVPPCKIGTKVFFITFESTDEKTEYFLCEGVIESFCLEGSGLWAHGRYTNGLTFWHKAES